jgi:hypothetical protein
MGNSGLPMAPVAPAKKIFIPDLLSNLMTDHSTKNLNRKIMTVTQV